MILVDLFFWLCDHWEEVTLNGVLLLLLRKFIMSEVHKLLYFNRDEELHWMRVKVEELTGEKWNGQQPIWKRVETRYIKNYYSYLRKVSKQKRRRFIMKAYLKKLGKTKLQAFLLATFINMALLAGYLFDLQDIQSKVDAWMPIVNMVIQLVLTIVYQWVEGSIDKASLKATGKEYTTGGAADDNFTTPVESTE